MTRKLRRYRIWPGALLGMRPGALFECKATPVPDGAHIEATSVTMPTAGGHMIDILVSHKEFSEVPDGHEVPLFDGPVFTQVRRDHG